MKDSYDGFKGGDWLHQVIIMPLDSTHHFKPGIREGEASSGIAMFNNFSSIQAAVSISILGRGLPVGMGTYFTAVLSCENLPSNALQSFHCLCFLFDWIYRL